MQEWLFSQEVILPQLTECVASVTRCTPNLRGIKITSLENIDELDAILSSIQCSGVEVYTLRPLPPSAICLPTLF